MPFTVFFSQVDHKKLIQALVNHYTMDAHQIICHRWIFIVACMFVVERRFSVMSCEMPSKIWFSMHETCEQQIAIWVEVSCTIACCDQIDNTSPSMTHDFSMTLSGCSASTCASSRS